MKQSFLNRFGNDWGLTFTEVVISLALLSLVMALLFRIGSETLPALTVRDKDALDRGKELVFREALAREVSRIRPAWYLGEYTIKTERDRWELSWYKGVKSRSLYLENQGGSLIMGVSDIDEKILYAFPGVRVDTLTLLRNLSSAPFLVELKTRGFINGFSYYPLGGTITPGREIPW